MSAPYTIYDAFWLDGWSDVVLAVPAATATVAAVAPALKASFGVPASAASTSTTAGFAVTFAVPTMTNTDTAFAPTLEITYTVPAMTAAAAMVAPDFTTEAPARSRVHGVGNGVVQVWELEEILRSQYTYLAPAMQARAAMGAPRLVVSELPMDADLSLLLELELV